MCKSVAQHQCARPSTIHPSIHPFTMTLWRVVAARVAQRWATIPRHMQHCVHALRAQRQRTLCTSSSSSAAAAAARAATGRRTSPQQRRHDQLKTHAPRVRHPFVSGSYNGVKFFNAKDNFQATAWESSVQTPFTVPHVVCARQTNTAVR